MKFWGKYKGFCVDNNDPKMQGRIRAEVPYPLGQGRGCWSYWALPCFPSGQFDVPEEGDGVWIEFEGGDPSKPIWSGIWYRGAGDASTAPFQTTHEPLVDMDGAEVDSDKADHTTGADDSEHKEWHNHTDQFYTPHRRGWRSGSGHTMEMNDHPGRKGYLSLSDRFGRAVEFMAKGFTRISGLLNFDNTRLDENGEARHQLVFADKENENNADYVDFPRLSLKRADGTPLDQKQYIMLRDAAQAYLLFLSTPGEELIELADFTQQALRIGSVEGSEYIELVDKSGQTVKLNVATGTVRVQDAEGNFVLMENGKVTVETVSGHIVLNVPAASHVHIGGEGGEELATKSFVSQQYNAHTHVSGSPGSPTSPPMVQSPLVPGNDITKKQKSE